MAKRFLARSRGLIESLGILGSALLFASAAAAGVINDSPITASQVFRDDLHVSVLSGPEKLIGGEADGASYILDTGIAAFVANNSSGQKWDVGWANTNLQNNVIS
ncbi:MAG: hypothetical protein ACREHD_05135, partial [Pirellulales bacterium]